MKKLIYSISLLSLIFCLANCASSDQDEGAIQESGLESAGSEDSVLTAVPEKSSDSAGPTVTASPPSEAPPSEPVQENCLSMHNGGCPGDSDDENGTGEDSGVGFHTSNGA